MKKPIDVAALFPEIHEIRDVALREKVIAVWEELWARSEWTDIALVPISLEIRYPHVPHNRAVLAMALAAAEAYAKFHGVEVDQDHLIAAGLLQDASKLVETRPGPNGEPVLSKIGRTYPHAFWGAHVALQKGVSDPIVHIILNHTSDSPTFPASLKGKILYYVDQLDVLAVHKDRWRKHLMITK